MRGIVFSYYSVIQNIQTLMLICRLALINEKAGNTVIQYILIITNTSGICTGKRKYSILN